MFPSTEIQSSRNDSFPLVKKKHNSLLVFVFASSIKLTLVQTREDCQLVRQTMHGRVPAARKPKAAQWQTQSHRGICFYHIFDETIFLRHFLDVKSNSKVRNADGMQNSGKADVLKKLEQFEQNMHLTQNCLQGTRRRKPASNG